MSLRGFSRENELHHEGGPGDERVAEHHIGTNENIVRVFGNHRRTEVIPPRVSVKKIIGLLPDRSVM